MNPDQATGNVPSSWLLVAPLQMHQAMQAVVVPSALQQQGLRYYDSTLNSRWWAEDADDLLGLCHAFPTVLGNVVISSWHVQHPHQIECQCHGIKVIPASAPHMNG
jgi:hypothetical protein